MNHIENTFVGVGNLVLYWQAWLPDDKPDALLVLVHGVNENSGHYSRLVEVFTKRGMAVYAYDARGHGRSEGQTGHIDHFSDYRGDLRRFITLVQSEQPGLPIFLYGHSMGGLVVADFIEQCPSGVRGAVISAAPFEPVGVAKGSLVLLARIMSVVYPRFSVNLGLKGGDVYRDKAAQERSDSDPFLRHAVSARWGVEHLRTIDEVKQNSKCITTPFLILHGDQDKLNSWQGAQAFFDSVPFADKEIKIYPGYYHAMHDDIGHEILLKDAGDWVLRHI
jgi:alpha-beta hydrolase superfamily lysophospholipase